MSKNRDHQLVFSLRKLSVGLASVAIATTFFAAGNVQTVHADALKSAEKQQISTVKQTESTDNTESVVGG